MDDELGRKLQDFDLAIESAPYYGLKKDQAEKEIDMIKSIKYRYNRSYNSHYGNL